MVFLLLGLLAAMSFALIGLGGNLGPVAETFQSAIAELNQQPGLQVLTQSSVAVVTLFRRSWFWHKFRRVCFSAALP